MSYFKEESRSSSHFYIYNILYKTNLEVRHISRITHNVLRGASVKWKKNEKNTRLLKTLRNRLNYNTNQ